MLKKKRHIKWLFTGEKDKNSKGETRDICVKEGSEIQISM